MTFSLSPTSSLLKLLNFSWNTKSSFSFKTGFKMDQKSKVIMRWLILIFCEYFHILAFTFGIDTSHSENNLKSRNRIKSGWCRNPKPMLTEKLLSVLNFIQEIKHIYTLWSDIWNISYIELRMWNILQLQRGLNPYLAIPVRRFIPHGLIRPHKWPAPNVSGFIAQLVRASHRYREVTGSNHVEVLTFSGLYTQLH